jgi:hypothetical protein
MPTTVFLHAALQYPGGYDVLVQPLNVVRHVAVPESNLLEFWPITRQGDDHYGETVHVTIIRSKQ